MVVGVGTNTVNPSGRSVGLSSTPSFAGRAGGVTLEQLEPQRGVTQVVSIARPDIDTLTILVPGPFPDDDVMLGE